MRVQIIREKRFTAAGPQGPFTRVFEVGDVIDLDVVHAQMLVAEGTAQRAPDDAKPARKPAAKTKK